MILIIVFGLIIMLLALVALKLLVFDIKRNAEVKLTDYNGEPQTLEDVLMNEDRPVTIKVDRKTMRKLMRDPKAKQYLK